MTDLLNFYDGLIEEYKRDLERNLEQAKHASGDPYQMLERINMFLISEIARLKVQLLDMDIRISRFPEFYGEQPVLPTQAGRRVSMPAYTIGDVIPISSGISTYGFHRIETTMPGLVHRWAGPSNRFGMVVHIVREAPIQAKAFVPSVIAPDIEFLSVEIDNEQVPWVMQGKNLIFDIPALTTVKGPAATHISFEVNKSPVVKDVKPGSKDTRQVSFAFREISLAPAGAFDEPKPVPAAADASKATGAAEESTATEGADADSSQTS